MAKSPAPSMHLSAHRSGCSGPGAEESRLLIFCRKPRPVPQILRSDWLPEEPLVWNRTLPNSSRRERVRMSRTPLAAAHQILD
uniref:Uncharacterized protein n=1 Tax=Knipowitschia caucasica TaxID=637954 RepID=A0AAV2KF62_KNICA